MFTHEYTHVLHLERSGGWFGAIGRPFGRVPLFYPNLFLPPMLIEGIATHEESEATGEGRIPAGDFRMLMGAAAAAGRFPSLAKASNAVVAWPSGLTAYVFGGYFHDYLARTYGQASLERLSDETASRLPYLGVRAFRKVYGKPLGDLWKDFQKDASSRAAADAPRRTQLTRHGFNVSAPWHSTDGRVFYSVATPHAYPALMELTAAGPRKLTTKIAGGRIGGTAGEVVFDQVEYVRSVAVQSDLYAVDRERGSVRRLTRHARAADPDVSPDGRTIVCTVQRPDGRALATLPVPAPGATGTPALLLSEPSVDFASPRWSPDGRTIAAERRKLRGASEIVILDAASGAVRRTVTSHDGARSTGPEWSSDSATLYFAADRGGKPFQIYSIDLAGGPPRRLSNAGDSAQSPSLSPDGRTIVFVGYTASGFDLFSMPVADAIWEAEPAEPAAIAGPEPAVAAPAAAGTIKDSNYNPLRTLVPRFWTPVVAWDDDELSVGAGTGGFDALGRHGYFGSATWTARARPDWFAAYAYDRWRPTLFADASDDTDPWREGSVRVKEVNAGALLRFRTVLRSQLLLGSFHSASEVFDCASCETPVDVTVTRRALRAAWSFDTSRRYGYSISDEYGMAVTASTEWTWKALGATGDAAAVIVDGRGYVAVGPRHAALAVRAAGASAWGDRRVRRLFGAGGDGPQSGGIQFDLDAIALVRGFEAGDVTGRRAGSRECGLPRAARLDRAGPGYVAAVRAVAPRRRVRGRWRRLELGALAERSPRVVRRRTVVRRRARILAAVDGRCGCRLAVRSDRPVGWRCGVCAHRSGVLRSTPSPALLLE